MKKYTLKTPLGRFLLAGMLEGISFLLLLGVAMPLKYLAGFPEAVEVAGMAHGILFVLYVILLVQCMVELKWSFGKAVLAFGASLIPLGPFFLDRILLRDKAQ